MLTVRTDVGLPLSLDDFADGGGFAVFPWGEGLIAARGSGPSPTAEERRLSLFYAPASDTTAQWQQVQTDLPTEIIDAGDNVSVTVAGDRLVVYTDQPEQTRYRLLIATTLDLETWQVDALEIERPPALPETVDWSVGTWSPVIFSDNGWIARINADSTVQQVWIGSWGGEPIRTDHDFQSERLLAVGDLFIRFPSQGGSGWSSQDGIEWASIEIPQLGTANGALFAMPFGDDVVLLTDDIGGRQVIYRVDTVGTWHPIRITGLPEGWYSGEDLEQGSHLSGWSGIGPSPDTMFKLPNSPHLVLETTEHSAWLILTKGQDWFAEVLFDTQS